MATLKPKLYKVELEMFGSIRTTRNVIATSQREALRKLGEHGNVKRVWQDVTARSVLVRNFLDKAKK